MTLSDKKDIIDSALVLRQWQNTKNPFDIAKAMGIKIKLFHNSSIRGYSICSATEKQIWINANLSEKQKITVCTHEIGHIVCEHTGQSYYKDNDLDKEYCANLFAVSFLCLYDGLYQKLYRELYNEFGSQEAIINLPNFTLQTILERETTNN